MNALMLDYIYDHEAAQSKKVFLTQPIGSGEVVDYTCGQMMDQARRIAAHLKGLGLAPGTRIAMLAKNSLASVAPMTTPGIHAPAPGGGVRLATAGLRVLASTRVPDAAAIRVITTKLRSKLLAQPAALTRFFIWAF